jgi:hypothetical protein
MRLPNLSLPHLIRSGLTTVSRLTILALFSFSFTPRMPIAQAQRESSLQQEIDAIKSVAQVKTTLKQLLETRDTCAVGSCFNSVSTAICNQIGLLDVRVNGQILQSMVSDKPSGLAISKTDLALMKQMFSQCKPTNYQYWNWDTILHVYYVPSCPIDRQVRKALGVKPSNQRGSCSP